VKHLSIRFVVELGVLSRRSPTETVLSADVVVLGLSVRFLLCTFRLAIGTVSARSFLLALLTSSQFTLVRLTAAAVAARQGSDQDYTSYHTHGDEERFEVHHTIHPSCVGQGTVRGEHAS